MNRASTMSQETIPWSINSTNALSMYESASPVLKKWTKYCKGCRSHHNRLWFRIDAYQVLFSIIEIRARCPFILINSWAKVVSPENSANWRRWSISTLPGFVIPSYIDWAVIAWEAIENIAIIQMKFTQIYEMNI
jgi:hypothetical protein